MAEGREIDAALGGQRHGFASELPAGTEQKNARQDASPSLASDDGAVSSPSRWPL